MFIPVQKYKSQYKNKSCSTKLKKKWKEKYNNSTTMCIPVQKYIFQYKTKSFGTEKCFFKNLEKTGRYSVYDYCYVPKYICLSFSYYRYYYVEFNIRNNSFAPSLSKIIKFEFSTQEANNGEYSANRRWQIVFL